MSRPAYNGGAVEHRNSGSSFLYRPCLREIERNVIEWSTQYPPLTSGHIPLYLLPFLFSSSILSSLPLSGIYEKNANM